MWNLKLLDILVIFISFEICSAQILQFGECSEVETMIYFDLEKSSHYVRVVEELDSLDVHMVFIMFTFLGKWYEIERFPTWYEENGNCAYKFINQCGRRIEIHHGFVRDNIQYIIHVNSSYNPGDEAVFAINNSNIDPLGIPLSVITTDYSNYAIVYGCKNRDLLGIHVRYISAWILSRQTTIAEDILERAHRELNSIPNANVAYLETVSQTEEHCKYSWTAHVDTEEKELDYDAEFNNRKWFIK